jgi:hypothetical protein
MSVRALSVLVGAEFLVVIVLGSGHRNQGGRLRRHILVDPQPFTPGALFAGSLPIALLFCYASFVLLGVLVLIEVAISVTLAGLPYVADEILATKGAMAPPFVCVIGTNASNSGRTSLVLLGVEHAWLRAVAGAAMAASRTVSPHAARPSGQTAKLMTPLL